MAGALTMKAADIIAARLAVNESEIRHMREDIREIKEAIRETKVSMAAITATMQQVRGGWKALAAAGAVGGTIVAAAAKVVPLLTRSP